MALATVVRTEGSTYSKPGHRILIDADANYQGLVSGGCLEGDLAEHALGVIDEREARTVIYDMRGENDELFGLGVGCDGLLEILLQPLGPAHDYAPFPELISALLGDTPCTICVVIAGDNDTPPAGATAILRDDEATLVGIDSGWAQALRDAERPAESLVGNVAHDDSSARVLFDAVRPLARLLILGAGPDAIPLARMACDLGWHVTIGDHRPAYIGRIEFDCAEHRVRTIRFPAHCRQTSISGNRTP